MPLALHLVEAQLEAVALGRAGRVAVDRLVRRGWGAEDRVGAHAPRLRRWTLRTHCGSADRRRAASRRSRGRSRERFGLQLYVVDHRVWVHEARMPATEFASLTMDERWVHATPEQMLEWFSRTRGTASGCAGGPARRSRRAGGDRRGAAALPAVRRCCSRKRRPGALSPARPRRTCASVCSRAVRCAATSDGLRARENATARDLLIAELFAREARELRLPTLPVDAPLEEMIERAGGDARACRRRACRRAATSDGRSDAGDEAKEFRCETQVRLYEEWLATAQRRRRYVAVTTTHTMKPSDDAKTERSASVQPAPASTAPTDEHGDAARDSGLTEPARDLARAPGGERRADDRRRRAGRRRAGEQPVAEHGDHLERDVGGGRRRRRRSRRTRRARIASPWRRGSR